jgi:hypothetical protein
MTDNEVTKETLKALEQFNEFVHDAIADHVHLDYMSETQFLQECSKWFIEHKRVYPKRKEKI